MTPDRIKFALLLGVVLVVSGLLFNFFGLHRSVKNLHLHNNFITDETFAIVGDEASGSSVYVGTVDGKAKWKLRSQHQLSVPFLVDRFKLLLVQRIYDPSPEFSLIQFDFSKSEPTCQALVSSKKFILSPFKPIGRFADDILFFVGDYLEEREINRIPSRRLVILRDGKILRPDGPTFSTIGHLAQTGESQFLGISWNILPGGDLDGLGIVDKSGGNDIVTIDLSSEKLVASFVHVEGASIGDPLSVSTFSYPMSVLVRTYALTDSGSQSRYLVLSVGKLEVLEAIDLPVEYDFGDPFLTSGNGFADGVFAIAERSRDVLQDNTSYIARIRSGSQIDYTPIEIGSAIEFDMSKCAGDGVILE